MEEQSIFRTALSWMLFWLGDGVSRLSRILPDYRVFDFLHHSYGRLMGWSVNLDKAGKVWDHVDEEEGA